MKFTRYIFSSLILAGLLTLGSCRDDLSSEPDSATPENPDDEMVDVTLNFLIEDFNGGGTRGDNEGEGEGSPTEFFLSDIDLLVYALRDENDKVLYQYGQGIDNAFKKKVEDSKTGETKWVVDDNNYPAFKNYNEEVDNNQTLLKVEWVSLNKDGKGPYTLKSPIILRVMRGTVYKLSCWAQSSKITAYDFNYLTAVKVNYDGAKNNDKSRDAFCTTSIFSIGQVDSKVSVTLTRPFAQINVCINSSEDKEKYKGYTHSQIKLEGVATYFNVVKNRAWSIDEYKNWQVGIFGEHYNQSIFNEDEPIFQEDVTFDYSEYTKEELEIHDYSSSSWNGTGTPPIKKYNSLSMCYVLVPEATYTMDDDNTIIDQGTINGDGEVEGGIVAPSLENVKIKLKSFSIKDNNGNLKEISYPQNEEAKSISVKRNWRTNLLFEKWEDITGKPGNATD